MTVPDSKRAYELWNKPQEEDFTQNEIKFLKKYFKTKTIKVRYGFYKRKSSRGKQIVIVFDFYPLSPRKSGVENHWEIICERNITLEEIEEHIIQYFRITTRRFWAFWYKDIERLILDDSKLNAITPNDFIIECQKRGYSGQYQTQIEFIK